ncbi:hypothetical protein GQ44DRAFT_707996 [Phaeosphaeriaceae sp. PMI808]|nr:hypothetical protein GQ44DRAFT_707996 [Phaeosphaeriaceae sp. PMI808]
MKFLVVLSALVAIAMAAPSTDAPALDLMEKRCLGRGVPTNDFRLCCTGQGFADRGCACTVCS